MQEAPDRRTSSESSRAEAERQLVAAAERHREVVASMQELGRPEAGQHVSVKSVGRAVHLVSFALRRAAEAGVPFDRLVELTGWEPDLVREGLERVAPKPWFVARLAPAGVDARAVAQAAARFEVTTRVRTSRSACSLTSTTMPGRRSPPSSTTYTCAWTARGASGATGWDDRRPRPSAEARRPPAPGAAPATGAAGLVRPRWSASARTIAVVAVLIDVL